MTGSVDSSMPISLPLLPLKNVVVLPKGIVPIIVGRQSSIAAVEQALKGDRSLFITAQRVADIETPTADDLYMVGTRSSILQVMRMPKGGLKILVEGISRSKAASIHELDGSLVAVATDLPTTGNESETEVIAVWRHIQDVYGTYAQLNSKAPADLLINGKTVDDIDGLVDMLAVQLNLSIEERQTVLELNDLKERLYRVYALLKKEIDILETEERIRGRIQTQVEKNQREYYLTEQIKAIQKELGRDDHTAEIATIRSKIKTLGMPAEALDKVEKELKRLETMQPLSAEAVVSRHYIDWLIGLPWQRVSKDAISLENAEKILNKKHAHLRKPKERIIEFLAAKKFSEAFERSPIICLVGPPGVGKTSLASSIAESLGREFVRISLGGIRDEAEIRGHRRTYVGALPGKIIQAMRKANTKNPVILLDEIDKMSSDVHGDPAAALLEVLDPEQNRSFTDHFLEVEYDLSKVMFITTANHTEGIPYPLFDRMDVITLSGYTDDEKLQIAQDFLIPKNLKEYGLKARQCKISEKILCTIISEYTKEAGVRQLDRVIAKILRKIIQILLKEPTKKSVTVTPAHIQEWLGYPKFKKTALDQGAERIGLATGLAWTELGGDILEVEATIVPGKGNLTLTGQLGDVMQESAQAAFSYIRARARELGLASSFSSTKDIHLHVPEGATPKDGPSAGITMCVALVSALTKNPVRRDVAMTGEITLRGRVLAVGGLKEKLLAARQHGMKKVIVPHENRDDIEEARADLGGSLGIEVVYAEHMDTVLNETLTNPIVSLKRPMKVRKSRSSKTTTRSS